MLRKKHRLFFKLFVVLVLQILFYSTAQAQISQAEYFWDNDPGQGLATSINASDGTLDEAIEQLLNDPTSLPAGTGPHTFNVRVKDAPNNWGPVFTSVINIETVITATDKQVILAEYFWDSDPGVGNGTAILALDGNLDEAIETLFNSGVSQPVVGLHTFNIRVKDYGNNWGPVFSSVVNIENTIVSTDKQIIQAEYFWDSDPGVGSATPILALDGNLDEAIETLFSSGVSQPAVGLHTFNIRVKDFDNNWSPIFTSVMSIEDTIVPIDKQIIQAEYFWDSDPGVGSATPLLALDGNLDEAIETLFNSGVSQPAVGLHTFNIRVKDIENTWGPLFTSVISIEDTIVPVVKEIAQAEYFWDTDPGQGSGTTILALDGNLDEAIESLFESAATTVSLSLGVHSFNIRTLDAEGHWSPVFTNVIEVTDCIAPLVDLGVDTVLCNGSSMMLDASDHFDSYSWNTGGTGQTILINSPGTYYVHATDTLGCIRSDTIIISDQQYLDLGNDTTICAGTNLFLDAGVYNAYAWSTGSSSSGITVNPVVNSQYSATVTDISGCTSSDTILVDVYALPSPYLGVDTAICQGDSLTLDAGSFSTYLWSPSGGSQTLTVSSAGTYSVTVTNVNGCSNSDAIYVGINALPTPDLGSDIILCDGGSEVLNPGSFDQYKWSDLSTNPTLSVGNAGTYYVTVTDVNSCQNMDSVQVDTSSSVHVYSSEAICDGDSYNFNGTMLSINGTYFDTLATSMGCDSVIELSLTVNLVPSVYLGVDQTLCDWDSVVLDAGVHNSYLWSTGYTGQTITVDTSSTGIGTFAYSVEVEDNNCYASDTILITFTNCVGLTDYDYGEVLVYPNPTNGLIVLEFTRTDGTQYYIELFDIAGKLLFAEFLYPENGEVFRRDFTYLEKGVYLIKIGNDTSQSTFRLILE